MYRENETNDYTAYLHNEFASVIAPVARGKARELADALIGRFRSVEGALSAPSSELEKFAGEKVAVYLKTVAAVVSRRKTQGFEFGKSHTRKEIADYFTALYIPCETEKIALMLKDSANAVIDCKIVSDGTVNASEILPRKILEFAISKGSRKVILAHNHPMGRAVPSDDDIKLTACIADLLSVAGVVLEYHVIVAGQEANIIEP